MPFGHRWPGLGKSARNTESEIHRLAQVPDRQPNKRCNWRAVSLTPKWSLSFR